MSNGGFCTDCGHKVATFEGLNGCPSCGSRGAPCSDAEQVTVSINWHELRILAIWAENWQRDRVKTSKVVYAIAARLAAQHPGRTPLTLAGELGEVSKQFGGLSVSQPGLRQDIAEQTGQETGLISPIDPEAPATPAPGEQP